MPIHAHCQGADAPQGEKAIEGPRHGSHGILQELQPLGLGCMLGHDCTPDHVRVATQILRGGVDHQVGSQFERSLQVGGGEGIVHGHQQLQVAAPHLRADRGDVAHVEQGIGRALQPDQPGIRADGVQEFLGISRGAVAEL
jgi:hypothetical protein